MSERSLHERVAEKYDHGCTDFMLAYGSGAVLQANTDKTRRNIVDYMFIVQPEWVRQNMQANPDDYSWIAKRCGPGITAGVQRLGRARMYYHPFISEGDDEIKYGSIFTDDFIDDLEHWISLYPAGRMQKRTVTVKEPQDERITAAIEANYYSAVRAARLLLPDEFSEQQLYEAIAGLSYTGDLRMKGGENPHKVQNLVQGDLSGYRQIYCDRLQDLGVHEVGNNTYQQDTDDDTKAALCDALPSGLRVRLPEVPDADDVSAALEKIVRWPSAFMGAKGLLYSTSWEGAKRYIREKREKRARGMQAP